RYGVSLGAENVLPLIGSKEGIMHIAMTYVDPGDKVLIPNPGYPTYRSAFTLAGAQCVEYRLRGLHGWQPDMAEIEAAGMDGVKIMIVNFPNMPTGAMPHKGLFAELVAFARRHNILLVNDNPYSFIRTERPVSLLQTPGALEVAIELNSLSKSHNMAGWRVGAVMAHPRRISEIIRFKSNMDSGMFRPLQSAASEALSLGDEWYEALSRLYAEREESGYRIMEALGCGADKGQAGLFVWGRIPDDAADCFAFSDKILADYDVFITPGGIFGSEGMRYVRISLCADRATLDKVCERIESKR
ncbi:MAG: aminotransferase class I/II-fold pyridoxal phosphate-dependent enzyme, partial [Rikenellaceae bacterium]|nr:aminotransferase class I/II-fold pyridoxal phosphate-dependent enzyme [Rikenellaceae bacterium]